MAYDLVIKTLAEKDISQAVEWYAKQSQQLLPKLVKSIDNSLESIRENPEHYQKRYEEVRIVFTQKYPYGIYYTVEENTVFVHAILHTKQNPETGIGRLN